jgi:hypothetical protein
MRDKRNSSIPIYRLSFIFCIMLALPSIGQIQTISTDHPAFAGRRTVVLSVPGFSGIRGRVLDAETDAGLPARVVVRDSAGIVLKSHYQNLPGFFTEEDGHFSVPLKPGVYTIETFHGIDCLSRSDTVRVRADSCADASISLQPWVPLRKLGWVNGDGHAHLYTDKPDNEAMLAEVRQICLAQGVDFVCANQGWAGYTDSTWREAYGKKSDGRFLMSYGAEMPKYRTGHTWWLGLRSTCGYFNDAMDTTYENLYYQSPIKTGWTFTDLPFPNVPDVELIPRFKKAQDALAVIPHPCSWWMQERGSISKYTSNAAVSLAFGLLAGNVWDGLVVMGYDADHYFYQNLWFHVLNLGYHVPAFAELDGGYGPDNRFPYGLYRTYFYTEGKLDLESVKNAVRHGRTFVTSGPVLLANVDGRYRIGDTVPSGGERHVLNVDAYSSGDREDHLSYVAVFRNGTLFRVWDLRKDKPRHFRTEMILEEKRSAWYAVKAYGRRAWTDPSNLDVTRVCEKIQKGTFRDGGGERDVCITSPIYFSPTGKNEPAPFNSSVSLTVISPADGKPLPNVKVHLRVAGEEIRAIPLPAGSAEFTMPVQAVLLVEAEGYASIRRSLFLDYPPDRDLIETLASGRWLSKNRWNSLLRPGQVPWEAFNFSETKHILGHVRWTIVMQTNERDGALARLDQSLFRCP